MWHTSGLERRSQIFDLCVLIQGLFAKLKGCRAFLLVPNPQANPALLAEQQSPVQGMEHAARGTNEETRNCSKTGGGGRAHRELTQPVRF